MILIDAYNFLHAASATHGAVTGLSLRQLCRVLQELPGQVILVIDGVPKPEEPGENEFPTLTLLYSGRAAKADDLIARLLEKSTGARNITVVSNDRAVAANARRAGAHCLSCENFLGRLTESRSRQARRRSEPEEKSQGLSAPGLTDAWLKEFGFKPPTRHDERSHTEPQKHRDDDTPSSRWTRPGYPDESGLRRDERRGDTGTR